MQNTPYLTSSLILIIGLVFTGCGYLDEDIHLSDEAFTLSAGGLDLLHDGAAYSSGCGGRHVGLYSSRKVRKARVSVGEPEVFAEGVEAPEYAFELEDVARQEGGFMRDEEDDTHDDATLVTNHDMLTAIASQHAHR